MKLICVLAVLVGFACVVQGAFPVPGLMGDFMSKMTGERTIEGAATNLFGQFVGGALGGMFGKKDEDSFGFSSTTSSRNGAEGGSCKQRSKQNDDD